MSNPASLFVLLGVLGGVATSHLSAQSATPSASGIYSAAQARRGEALYAVHCAPCHGTELSGTEFGPGLTTPDLQARWKNRMLGDLFTLMRTTMPLTSPGGLSAQQNADVLAFMLQRASQPAGSSDLSSEAAALAKIPFPLR